MDAITIAHMQRCLQLAEKAALADEVPVGALIVKDGQIIAEAYNQKEGLQKVTAHAEILAIEEACKRLNQWRLLDCEMYVTLEPCLMCAGAIQSARISKLYYGIKDPKGGAIDSLYQVLSDSRLNHQLEVTSGVLEKECSEILKQFFKAKR